MANQHVNKVQFGSDVLIDLTSDTVDAAHLATGYTAHDASGALVTGTLDSVTGSVYQDADGYLVVDEGESTAPQGNVSITANGTYDVAEYAGATVNIPVGITKTNLKKLIERTSANFKIEWPDGLTRIGNYAFAYCPDLNLPALPSTVTSIGIYAFYNCQNINWTELPESVTSIGSNAFNTCTHLVLNNLPSALTIINPSAFTGCKELALNGLPNGIIRIDQYGFSYCVKLALTELPSALTQIGDYAFFGCTGIKSIACDGAITKLGSAAFTGSSIYPSALESASFPNMALTSNIGTVFGSSNVAQACQQLEFCDIGSTVGIAANAFANCEKLQTLVLRKTASVCTLANVSAFLNTPMRGYNDLTGTVYVPQALIESYKTATNWSTLYNDGTVTFATIEGSEYERD